MSYILYLYSLRDLKKKIMVRSARRMFLSLFGWLLSDQQNQKALKTTLRSAWKMGPDLRIVEVGNNILQFKFSSKYQMEWVEKSGQWNFDNNLLLLCWWRKGPTTENITFTHSPFWVQVWGLSFKHMIVETGKDIGCRLGRDIEVDILSWKQIMLKLCESGLTCRLINH